MVLETNNQQPQKLLIAVLNFILNVTRQIELIDRINGWINEISE